MEESKVDFDPTEGLSGPSLSSEEEDDTMDLFFEKISASDRNFKQNDRRASARIEKSNFFDDLPEPDER
jgi:hypothetical protein